MNREIVGAIAKPLAHAAHEQTLIAQALDCDMGLLLPPQSWRNQLPIDHPKRGGAFSDLPISRPVVEFSPEGEHGSGFLEAYAADHLQSEIRGRATLLTTPCHVLEQECGAGRRCDLQLAAHTVDEFQASRAWAGPDETVSRELYASLIVQGHHARDPHVIDSLVAAYAELDVMGYLIIAANYRKSAVQATGYAALGLRLQALTGRPAVIACVGFSQLAFLASGIAATWSGLHGMSFSYPPELVRGDAVSEVAAAAGGAAVATDEGEAGQDDDGFGVFVYHRDLLGYAGQLGAEGEAVRLAAFQNRPCSCGFHSPMRPPAAQGEIINHNAWAVSSDVEEFVTADVLETEQRLVARIERATRLRGLIGATGLSTDFLGVVREARRLRGVDSGEAEELA